MDTGLRMRGALQAAHHCGVLEDQAFQDAYTQQAQPSITHPLARSISGCIHTADAHHFVHVKTTIRGLDCHHCDEQELQLWIVQQPTGAAQGPGVGGLGLD